MNRVERYPDCILPDFNPDLVLARPSRGTPVHSLFPEGEWFSVGYVAGEPSFRCLTKVQRPCAASGRSAPHRGREQWPLWPECSGRPLQLFPIDGLSVAAH